MTALEILFTVILVFVVFVIGPIALNDHLGGQKATEKLFRKLRLPLSYKQFFGITVGCFVLLVIVFCLLITTGS